jgi:DNA-binding MarR family transcriptional regulator
MRTIDRVIHEPARLRVMTMLSGVAWADFVSVCRTLGLTRGNLSAHVARLERRGYVRVSKSIIGKLPHTQYKLTPAGRKALAGYWAAMDEIRRLDKTGPDQRS